MILPWPSGTGPSQPRVFSSQLDTSDGLENAANQEFQVKISMRPDEGFSTFPGAVIVAARPGLRVAQRAGAAARAAMAAAVTISRRLGSI